jgi:Putative zinc-finger
MDQPRRERPGRLSPLYLVCGTVRRSTAAMSDPGQCRQIRSALGIYLLGAIGPAERIAVDRHLAGCTDCREELAGLASLVGRLGTVPAADVVTLAADTGDDSGRPGAGQGGSGVLLRRAARQRRRMWRRVTVATAATALAAGAAVAGLPGLFAPAPQPVAVVWPETVSGSNPVSGAGAIVRYRARPWGVQIVVQVSRIPAGTHCELRVVTAAGQRATAASWTVAASRNGAWYPASAPFPEDGVRDFVVVSAGRTLVSVPAGDG